jgi:hypothetical protein
VTYGVGQIIPPHNVHASENCVLLGHYTASSGNFLPTKRDNLSAHFQGSSGTLVVGLYREECGGSDKAQ